MKKLTLLFYALILSTVAAAQDFPGKRPSLLTDKTIRVKPLPKGVLTYQQGYSGFYTDENLQKVYAETGNSKISVHETLADRTFKVIDVHPLKAEDYRISLQDTIKNETIFFRYNESDEAKGGYYFEVIGGLAYPPDFFCDYLQLEGTPDGAQRASAIITEGIKISKVTRGKTVQYTMEVRTVEEIISMLKGVSLVMENGLQIVRPDIHAEMFEANDRLVYVATFELTPHEVSLLWQSKIVSGKISKFEKVYNEGEKLRQMVKCMNSKLF